jgi:tRNA nucleotidyltransferase (CCA-adding enzyme)
MSKECWEHFPHGADVGVRGIGPTRAAAFAQAAVALTGAMTDPEVVAPTVAVDVGCSAPDDELLLMDWLNALVFEMATRDMLFARFELTIDDHALKAKAWGEPVDVARHHPAVEVKGATLTGLSVRRQNGDWVAECVIDV